MPPKVRHSRGFNTQNQYCAAPAAVVVQYLKIQIQYLNEGDKCFAFEVLLRSSKDDTHQHLYNTTQHVFNIEYLNIRFGEAVCSFNKSGEKRDPEGGSLELVKGSATLFLQHQIKVKNS